MRRMRPGHWQTFPGRELASILDWDCKRAQAGYTHWQAFPGRELASIPGRDCKRAQMMWCMHICVRVVDTDMEYFAMVTRA